MSSIIRLLTCRTQVLAAFTMLAALAMVVMPLQGAYAASVTVKNNCSYTVYPGMYPATYSNGGWEMTPGSSVSFTLNPGWNGRIWGRIGCNSSSPALCSTGQCGGTGLQCAGTTGVAGTSLAEFNLDASGTDWYDVSYVDGFDNPIGVTVSNSTCYSPATCTSGPISSCPAGELNGQDCASPCTEYDTDQYCCRGAYGTSATCVVGNWPQPEQSYVTNIHNSCPGEYAYAYDDNNGLHTCATGANYTVTFCPSGSTASTTIANGAYAMAPQNAPGLVMDDWQSGTESGNQIDIWPINNTGAQSWVFNNSGVSPAGYSNIAVSYGPYCVTASGSTSGSLVNLQPCNGSSGQAWQAVPAPTGYVFHPANNTSLCLDVQGDGTAAGTLIQAWTCNGGNNEEWVLSNN
ncbi:MAG: thaumatin family protein [Terracidiphilus sp.]